MNKIEKEQSKGIMRLHNNFVEAIFSLSADAKKVLLTILLHVNGSKNIKVYRKDIADRAGIDLSKLNAKHREELIEELMTKIITIRDIENPKNWVKIQLIGKTEYKDGYLQTKIDEELMPFILEARERLFTRFNIQNIKPLTSIHAIRIYLLLKQYDDTGWRTVEVDELKRMMELEDKYSRIFDLKKWVLEVAKRQINKNTDLEIDYKLRKEGKKYKFIDFKIKQKEVKQYEQPALLKVELSDIQKQLKKLLGKKVEGKHKITAFSMQGNNIIATTEIGDYTFPNLETLKANTK